MQWLCLGACGNVLQQCHEETGRESQLLQSRTNREKLSLPTLTGDFTANKGSSSPRVADLFPELGQGFWQKFLSMFFSVLVYYLRCG